MESIMTIDNIGIIGAKTLEQFEKVITIACVGKLSIAYFSETKCVIRIHEGFMRQLINMTR